MKTNTTTLAADIGGTKTVMALVEQGRLLRREVFPSAQFQSLESLIERFMGGPPRSISRACFGIAGPVIDDTCRATNLPWVVDARELERKLNLPRVSLVNDFHALAIGITVLPSSELATLNDAPSDPRGPWAVIGAGTGLGEAIVTKNGSSYEVLSSEGGHTDFGPRDQRELALLTYALGRFERVSYERLVSGPGLRLLYDFLRESQPALESAAVRSELEAVGDESSARISSHALAGDDRLCVETLELFVSLYGAEAGNLALKVLPRGGVYVAGGIAPKILPKLLDGRFRDAFLRKGRMRPLLERTPVKVVLNPDAGLIGAAAIASELTL